MDVKTEMDDEHCGEPEEKAKEGHGHTFSWKFGKEDPYNVVCKTAGTIYESLQNNDTFKEKASENQGKELVILKHKKAISSNFPCHKMTKLDIETLTIVYISTGNNLATTTSSKDKKINHGELVVFDVKTTGGTNILTKVLKNVGLRKIADEAIVYGYKDQTVRDALEQDGHFSDKVLNQKFVLEDTKTGYRTEMSTHVDYLDGKCFKIIKKPKSRKCLGAAKHDAPKEETSSKTASSCIPTPHQNVSNQPTPNTSHQPTTNKSVQLNREEIFNLLRSQFPDLTKHMKGRQKNAKSRDVRKLFSREFGRNSQFCHKMITLRRLVELGDSVCQVRINGEPAGSGFLLFGNYILTNAHVVLDEDKTKLRENITVVFNYEDDPVSLCSPLHVTVVDLTYLVNDGEEGYKEDWALLEVDDNQNTITGLPLLKDLGVVTESGPICIIGHPEGRFKMLDPCCAIPRDKCNFFFNHNYIFRDVQTYESCFYECSSGSPVFDQNFKVVSMHTGGFHFENNEHAIEYSHPLTLIIEQIIILMVRNKKVHVLLAMINCGIPPVVMDNIKEIVKCNPTEFVCTEDEMINLTESFCEEDQELLRGFFRNFPQWDEAMDTSS